jgi:hypothetical protein
MAAHGRSDAGGAVGQRIAIDRTREVGDSIIVSTNRSLTGTDGEGFDSPAAAADGTTFPAKLAVELFQVDDAIRRVFVHQNVVVVTRDGGWAGEARNASGKVIEEFFLFYPEA